MTAEQVKNWKVERDIARAIQDEDERAVALAAVYDHRDDMMMECIQHQADRIKKSLANDVVIESRIADIEEDMKPLKESDKDYREWKIKIQGGIMMWRILRYIAAAGGGALIWNLLNAPK